jgi:hypothetical protein
MYQHRPSGVYLRLILVEGEPQRVAVISIYILVVVLVVAAAVDHAVAA